MRNRGKAERLKIFFLLILLPVFVSLSCVDRGKSQEIEQTPPPKGKEIIHSKTAPKEPAKVARLGGKKGVYHTVERGQTLWRICKAYGVDMQEVARINEISDPTQLKVGQEIFIPGARRELKVEPAPSLVRGAPRVLQPQPKTSKSPPPSYGRKPGKLLWPVPGGKLYSPFGMRGGNMHEGMDISARAGTSVLAAADGKVTYSDDTIRGYGNMIVIKHPGNLSTVYAHNKRNLVKTGRFVKKGDKIAEVGESGRATGPHLHFEVREGKRAVDPMSHLR